MVEYTLHKFNNIHVPTDMFPLVGQERNQMQTRSINIEI